MSKQKYFYKIWITAWSKLDQEYKTLFYGNYKNEDEAKRSITRYGLLTSDKVKDITYYSEKTGKTTVVKGNSVFEF